MIRYKNTNGEILVVEGTLSTDLFIGETELFDGDLVYYNLLQDKIECKIIWSNIFNGWSLIRTDNSELGEIPIGQYGIPLPQLSI